MSGTLRDPGDASPIDAGKLASVLDKSQKVKEYVVESKRAEKNVVEVASRGDIESELAEAHAALGHSRDELAIAKAAEVGIESELADARVALGHSRDDLATAKASEQEARYRSLHDTETGLPNRDLFLARLDHGLIQSKRHQWELAVLCVDLNDFKAVNDTHGHQVGDRVLRTVARRLEASVRGEDTVSRYGGDEFMCVLLDVKGKAGAVDVAHKIAERIAEECHVAGVVLSGSASVGIAMYPNDGTTADALLKVADQEMYRAKRAGSAVNDG